MTDEKQYTSSARSIRYVEQSFSTQKYGQSSGVCNYFLLAVEKAIDGYQLASTSLNRELQGVPVSAEMNFVLYKLAPTATKLTLLFMRSQVKKENCLLSQHTPRTMVGSLFLEESHDVQAKQHKYLLRGTTILY